MPGSDDLGRTTATFDLQLDPAVVADKLGHADPAFTLKRYVGLRGNPDEEATRRSEDW